MHELPNPVRVLVLVITTRLTTPFLLLAARVRLRAGLEANYGHQQELDMIPLLMEKGYRPKVCEKTRSFVCYPLLSSEARSSFTKVDSGRA